jgi:hypothetical protein
MSRATPLLPPRPLVACYRVIFTFFVYYIFSRCIPYSSVCPLVVQSYTILDEGDNPLTHRKYAVVDGKSVFYLHDCF